MKHYQRQRRRGSTEDRPPVDNWTNYRIASTGCWIWQGRVNPKGYGLFSVGEYGTALAHRCFYIKYVAPVPDGLQLDHLCRVPSCVNPDHLEPVTGSENMRRANAVRTVCRNGLHDITRPDCWYVKADGRRTCRECWRIANRAAGAGYRARMMREHGSTRPLPTNHCSPPCDTDS